MQSGVIQHIESLKELIQVKGKPIKRTGHKAERYWQVQSQSKKTRSSTQELERVDGRSGLRIITCDCPRSSNASVGRQVSTRSPSSEYGTDYAPGSQGWWSFAHVFLVLRIGEVRATLFHYRVRKKDSGVLSIFQAQGVGRDTSREELCSSLERCTVPPLNVTSLLPRPTSALRLDGHAHQAVSLRSCPICRRRVGRTRIWRWSVGMFVSQHF